MFEKLNIIKPHEGFQLVTNKFVPSASDHTYFMEVSHITLGIVCNIYIYIFILRQKKLGLTLTAFIIRFHWEIMPLIYEMIVSIVSILSIIFKDYI